MVIASLLTTVCTSDVDLKDKNMDFLHYSQMSFVTILILKSSRKKAFFYPVTVFPALLFNDSLSLMNQLLVVNQKYTLQTR